jgi:hypothetical protein
VKCFQNSKLRNRLTELSIAGRLKLM